MHSELIYVFLFVNDLICFKALDIPVQFGLVQGGQAFGKKGLASRGIPRLSLRSPNVAATQFFCLKQKWQNLQTLMDQN